jgi:hypothetical protein
LKALKDELSRRGGFFGIELIGFAQTQAWGEAGSRPASAGVVAVLGLSLMLPVVDTCPSIWGLEHEKTALILLNRAVNRLVTFLRSLGHRSETSPSGAAALAEPAVSAGL